jgi:branched-chain amino acid transport system permease protein
MDLSIAAILAQDGLSSGAIYALLALALVLVFSVTRVILIPQGEFVAFGALTMAALQTGQYPHTVTLLVVLGVLAFLREAAGTLRHAPRRALAGRILVPAFARLVGAPLVLMAAVRLVAPYALSMPVQVALSLAIVVPMGPLLYRLAFEPLAEASVLVLLIVAVGVHLALTGAGLVMFGAEGSRTLPFTDARFALGSMAISGQSVVVLATAAVLILALYVYFDRTLAGKALRATAVNRLGAQLVGIGAIAAARMAFTLAAAIGAICGILIAPLTTIYYDSGFLIGLKGFVGAIIGGLASYPLAAAGAILVGLLEAYSAFWASAFKEVIVFTLIIPVLLWRSLRSAPTDEDH